MEQKYKNIKATKEFCFEQIKQANETLREIRETCDHPEEFRETCTYMTRPGQYWPNTVICGICGSVVSMPGIGNQIFPGDDDDPKPRKKKWSVFSSLKI